MYLTGAYLALLSWLSLAEWKVLERLIFVDPANVTFVLASVQGVLDGTPVSPSWQQRFAGPLLVVALGALTPDRLSALKLAHALLLAAANFVLFALARRRGASLRYSLFLVAGFGFAHLITAYRLEYPWDGIDVILFLLFGDWAARGGRLVALVPLLLVGAINHETILYVPLFCLLAPLDGAPSRKPVAFGAAAALALGGVILILRHVFYRGQPNLPGQEFEPVTPVIGNHLHVFHNLGTLFVSNWRAGRAHISLGLLAALGLLVWLARRPATRRAAIWSLCVIATIVCFGYTNETRHYLVLIAFWTAYAWPPPQRRSALGAIPSGT
jgi:hypothetical protein